MRRFRLAVAAVLVACASPLAQAQPLPTGTPLEPGATWLPRAVAEVQALDKAYARSRAFTVRVGEEARFGSLIIAVKACLVRPPDQPADAAAYLVITDTNEGAPGFHGWMFQNEPSVSMLEHPVFDIRLLGCSS